MVNKLILNDLKEKYIKERQCDGVLYTYRAFLDWLYENGLKISYSEGYLLGLLDFNNSLSHGGKS